MTDRPKISREIDRIVDAANEIYFTPETPEEEKAFLSRHLVQVTLPHSSPGNMPTWTRTNGALSLSIRPGWDYEKNKSLGYPYGSIPRLLLFWMTAEALRTKSRKIELGASLAAFTRDVGLSSNTGGGKRGDQTRLKNQMEKLFRATISFEANYQDESISGKRWLDMQIAPEGELWWDFKSPQQASFFNSWIELGEKFYGAIIAAPVPLDMRALKALKRSPFALDLYAWATYKTYALSKGKKKEQFIPWRAFIQQFGADYSTVKNFTQKAKATFVK
ncbi:MAG: replication protein RepA, partial [Nitrospinota bacterium]